MTRRPPRSTLFPSTTLSRSPPGIPQRRRRVRPRPRTRQALPDSLPIDVESAFEILLTAGVVDEPMVREACDWLASVAAPDRKSTRLNSSHPVISYGVLCLKK